LRRLRAALFAVAVTASLCSVTGPAAAKAASPQRSASQRLSAARQDRAMALATVSALRSKLPALQARLAELQKAAGEATIAVIQAIRNEQSAQQALATARETLDARARAAFEFGPATTL